MFLKTPLQYDKNRPYYIHGYTLRKVCLTSIYVNSNGVVVRVADFLRGDPILLLVAAFPYCIRHNIVIHARH